MDESNNICLLLHPPTLSQTPSHPLFLAMSSAETGKPEKTEKKRRFVGRRAAAALGAALAPQRRPVGRVLNQIPQDILDDPDLNESIKLLPSNYNFEIHKCVWNIRKHGASRVALQMPEGLLIYSLVISDILEQFCQVETVVMGDVSYGACCIDDYTARALDCDFIIHYAHLCLVPIDVTKIKVLYVFVTIDIDESHLANTLKKNFDRGAHIACFGTIQFNPTTACGPVWRPTPKNRFMSLRPRRCRCPRARSWAARRPGSTLRSTPWSTWAMAASISRAP